MVELDSLWDFNDPAGAEVNFREFLLTRISDSQRLECMTQIARSLGLQRKFDEAHEVLDQVASAMEPDSVVELRYMLERGRTINSSGGRVASRQVFHQAVEAGKLLGNDRLTADAMHMVAIVEDGDEALRWNLKTIEFCETSSDPGAKKWLASLYNNTGWSLFALARFEEALDHFLKARQEREANGQVQQEQIARWCIARCLRALRRNDEALAMQLQLTEQVDGKDQYVNEELAELYVLRNESDLASKHAKAAYDVLSQDAWFVAEEPERLERLKFLSGG